MYFFLINLKTYFFLVYKLYTSKCLRDQKCYSKRIKIQLRLNIKVGFISFNNNLIHQYFFKLNVMKCEVWINVECLVMYVVIKKDKYDPIKKNKKPLKI